jgi:hypothetical protein
MAGSSSAVSRSFTITKDDIQFSADSSDTYTMLLAVSHILAFSAIHHPIAGQSLMQQLERNLTDLFWFPSRC